MDSRGLACRTAVGGYWISPRQLAQLTGFCPSANHFEIRPSNLESFVLWRHPMNRASLSLVLVVLVLRTFALAGPKPRGDEPMDHPAPSYDMKAQALSHGHLRPIQAVTGELTWTR